ncbi:Holliday junction ATP-dependent DNA helicase RuvA [bacterium BMS3Abin10]|nr:Holliday junction ATP-dependent DNA helicase RuvA [bacterium BMS3Abin10]GBE38356.1 Holliday junction ATP-dependent DNA helicase RuvA [bacterium BMS3Bbin08]
MIASLKGIVYSKKPEEIVVDVHGIGYHVCVPLSSLGSMPSPGEEVFLHTYTHVREDALQLYGFLSEEEKKIFIKLININGVGPKLGLAILSGMPVERFIEAVHNEDLPMLTTISGLGKKTASRLILELRGKLLPQDTTSFSREHQTAGDAVSALINLGYKKTDSEKAVETALTGSSGSLEDIIKEALKHLTKNK